MFGANSEVLASGRESASQPHSVDANGGAVFVPAHPGTPPAPAHCAALCWLEGQSFKAGPYKTG